jgi:GMP synthase (glutamine-hydrolysing)
MPRSVLILQHVPWEGPAILGDRLTSQAVPWRSGSFLYGPPPTDLSDIGGLAILGGPMGALDFERYPGLREEAELVRSVVDRGLPLLGICLGHQILSTALGAKLHSGAVNEVGIGMIDVVADDRALGAPASTAPVLHWHTDVVEAPAGAAIVASSAQTPNQAQRIGDLIFSTQFHVEVDRQMLDDWLAVEEMSDELAPDVRLSIRDDFDAASAEMRELANRVFTDFADSVLARD